MFRPTSQRGDIFQTWVMVSISPMNRREAVRQKCPPFDTRVTGHVTDFVTKNSAMSMRRGLNEAFKRCLRQYTRLYEYSNSGKSLARSRPPERSSSVPVSSFMVNYKICGLKVSNLPILPSVFVTQKSISSKVT